jgi:hypothetical protein
MRRAQQFPVRRGADKARRQMVKQGYRPLLCPPGCDAIILPPAAVKDVDEMIAGGVGADRQAIYQRALHIGFEALAKELEGSKSIIIPGVSVAEQILDKTDEQRKKGEIV